MSLRTGHHQHCDDAPSCGSPGLAICSLLLSFISCSRSSLMTFQAAYTYRAWLSTWDTYEIVLSGMSLLVNSLSCSPPHRGRPPTSFLLTNALSTPSLTHKHLLTFSNSILLPVTYRNTHTHCACFLHKQCTQKPEDNCKVMYDILNLHSVLHFCLFCGLYLYYLLFTGKPLLHSQTSTMY